LTLCTPRNINAIFAIADIAVGPDYRSVRRHAVNRPVDLLREDTKGEDVTKKDQRGRIRTPDNPDVLALIVSNELSLSAREPDPDIRQNGISQATEILLSKRGPQPSAHIHSLFKFAKTDNSPGIRTNTVRQIVSLLLSEGNPYTPENVKKLYATALDDENPRARLAAIVGIRNLLTKRDDLGAAENVAVLSEIIREELKKIWFDLEAAWNGPRENAPALCVDALHRAGDLFHVHRNEGLFKEEKNIFKDDEPLPVPKSVQQLLQLIGQESGHVAVRGAIVGFSKAAVYPDSKPG